MQEIDKAKEVKIKSEKISTLPIWGLYQDGKRIDFFNRETNINNGLTRQGVIEILLDKGYRIIN